MNKLVACVTALAASVFVPAAAIAQADRAAAQAEIKSRLESVRAPMFSSGGSTVAGVTATYAVSGSGCDTVVEISLPSHVIGTTSHAARTERVVIPWASAQSVEQPAANQGQYVVIRAPGLPSSGRYFYGAANAALLKAAMERLMRACGVAPAPGPMPTPAPAPSPATHIAFPAQIVGEYLNQGAIPRAWTFAYSHRDAGVYVFNATADLKANPASAILSGDTYLRRDVCGDQDLKAFVVQGVQLRIDTKYVGASGTRTNRGNVLSRCP